MGCSRISSRMLLNGDSRMRASGGLPWKRNTYVVCRFIKEGSQESETEHKPVCTGLPRPEMRRPSRGSVPTRRRASGRTATSRGRTWPCRPRRLPSWWASRPDWSRRSRDSRSRARGSPGGGGRRTGPRGARGRASPCCRACRGRRDARTRTTWSGTKTCNN